MKENVQAHQGQVTFLRVSASFSESRDSLASYDHLVSCGTDCTVRVWQLIHREIIYVSIQQMALVKLLQLPRDLAMAGNTLCMAMADNSVVMCRFGFVITITVQSLYLITRSPDTEVSVIHSSSIFCFTSPVSCIGLDIEAYLCHWLLSPN